MTGSKNTPNDSDANNPNQFSLIDYLNELVDVPPQTRPYWAGLVADIWNNLRLAVLNRCDTFGYTPGDGLCYFKIENGSATPRLIGDSKFLFGVRNHQDVQEVLRQCIEQNPQLSPFFHLTTFTEDTMLYTIGLAKIPPPVNELELLLDTLGYVGIHRNYSLVEELAHLTENAVFE